MTGQNNLDLLLKDMRPALHDGSYVFLTSPDGFSPAVQKDAIMIFRETEGITAIVREITAKTLQKDLQPQWAMITLTIHSDLNAIGFLAAITAKLAQAGISVNPVSAYYHDHLFVPWEKREKAMKILQSFSGISSTSL